MEKLSFHHIALNADHFDASVKFFKGIGLTEKCKWGDWDNNKDRAIMLSMGDGGIVELFQKDGQPEEQNPKWAHLAFACNDVDAMYNAALEAGAEPKTPPADVDIPSSPVLAVRIAFVTGPSGEVVEFFHEKA